MIAADEEAADETTEETVDVVGAIDVEALDYACDTPVSLKDAHSTFKSLVHLAQSTSETLFDRASSPSALVKRWLDGVMRTQTEKEDAGELPPLKREPLVAGDGGGASDDSASAGRDSYSTRHAFNDIDRRLEIEDADRTGRHDYASVINDARVLRRGPRATSSSRYETLPLLNRVLARARLRFYGHPPEAALRPAAGPLHARGQCWSFPHEEGATWQVDGAPSQDGRGEYATLTVSLASSVAVSEVVIEHLPSTVSENPQTAIKDFRIVGYEDGGAFGEAWELGTYQFLNGSNLQTFSIPSSSEGGEVPRLKSISLAVDSNWGGDYSCLYRFRVHGA